MKKTNLKKAISLFLTVVMLLSCWVFVPGEHNHASAAVKTINLSGLAAISNGSGNRADSSKIVICSDGEAANTTVGNAKFNISSLPNTVTNAKLYISTGNHNGTLANSTVKVYMIDPSKCAAKSVGHAVNNIYTVYGGNYSETQGVKNAYNYYGISESQALGGYVIRQDSPGTHVIDITSAVNQAKANGWSDLCLAFIMPSIYKDTNNNSWSDLHINVSGTYISCEHEGAYGMPAVGVGNGLDGYIKTTWGSTITVWYPTKMYIDISEDLSDAGYSINVSCNGNNRMIVFPTIWGGQESDTNSNFENDRTNYDAVLKGQNTIINNFDKYGIRVDNKYSSFANETTDGEYTTVLLRDNASQYLSKGESYPLQGKPKTTGVFRYYLKGYYNTSTADPKLTYMGGGSTTYLSNTNYIDGNVDFTITVYDKAALNNTYIKAGKIYELANKHSEFIKEGYEVFKSYYNSTTPNLLKTRVTTQSAIDSENTGLENAIKGLKFYASNANLRAAVNNASAIMNEAGYSSKYTAASRQVLETAYNNAVNSVFFSSIPVYQITNLSDSSTWNVSEKAYNDQVVIDNLANAINNVIMDIQDYTVTFTDINGNVTSGTYDYGTSIVAPKNSTKASDANYHYEYIWAPVFSNTVTYDVNYNEIETKEEHIWLVDSTTDSQGWNVTVVPNCKDSGIKSRTCSKCNYTQKETLPADTTAHNDTITIPGTNATCTADGYTEGVWCYTCETWISGHEVIPAAHTVEIVTGKKPTCSETGLTQGKKCSVCGTIIEAQQTIPVVDHTPADQPIKENVNNPTCGQPGSYDLVTYCTVCNKPVYSETFSVDATGEHNWSASYTSNGNDKDETHYQTCTVCGGENTAFAHTWDTGMITDEADCINDGSVVYICTANGCGATYTDVIPATGEHTFGDWSWYNGGDKHRRICKVDGCLAYEEGEHNFNGAIRQDANNNYHDYKCEFCEAYGVGTVLNSKEGCFGNGTVCTQIDGDAALHTETCKCGRITTDNHSYNAWFADPDNNENNLGKMSRICTECSYKDTTACNYTATETVVADCTKPGYTTWECNDCGNGYTETFAQLEHTEEVVPGKDATCTDTGLTEGKKCSVCGVTLVEQTVIPKAGHTEEVVPGKDATCTDTGLTEGKKCSVCGVTLVEQTTIPNTGHTEEVVPGKDATCTDTGLTEGKKCSVCGETLVKQTVIPNTGHTEEVVPGKDATCTDEGLTEGKKCSVCGVTLVEQTTIPNTGHTEEVVPGKDATCTDAGLTEGKKCSVCGETLVKQTVIPKAGHTEEVVPGKDATCTDAGLTEGKKCSVCGETLVKQTVIPKAGHTEEVVPGKDATCTDEGLTEGKKCSVCGETLVEQTTIPNTGHTEEVVPGKDATCTDEGLTEGKKCSICGETLVKQTVIPNTGHTEEVVPGKDATCTDTGLTEGKKCSVCGETLVKQTVIPAGHTLEQVDAKEATCTEAGYDAYEYCTECEYTTYVEIPALKHDYKGVVTKDATCTEPGVMTYTCQNDSTHTYTEEIVIDSNGHKASDDYVQTVAPTCTSFGEEVLYCVYCNDVLDTRVLAKESDAHKAKAEYTVVTESTCCLAGQEVLYCEYCNDVIDTREIPVDVNAHSWGQWIQTSAPTCCTEGLETRICANDSNHIDTKPIAVDNDAHVWGDWVVTKNATCAVDGEETRICQLSADHKQTRAIYSDDHDYRYETSAPSCEMNGYKITTCANCDYEETEILKATGHKFGGWFVAEGATCQHGEITHRVCSVCKETEEHIDNNLGLHSYVIVPGKPATCFQDGSTDYTRCVVCGETSYSEIIPAIPHEDADGDGKCDHCESTFAQGIFCGCLCHKEGAFMQFIYKIVRFLWKLFGIGKSCDCGNIHY